MKKHVYLGKIILTIGLFFLLFGVTNVNAETLIDDVSVTGLKEPVIGETIGDNTANVSVPEGANYTIDQIIWWGSEDGMYFYDIQDPTYAFEEGFYYYCSITFKANDGYEFKTNETNSFEGTLTASDLTNFDSYLEEPGMLWAYGIDYFYLSTEETEETPAATPVVASTNEITPPNTGINTPNKNDYIAASISMLVLTIVGLYYKKKLFN